MFNTLSPRELEKVNTLSESERKLDIGSMMNKIQKHVTKILSKYLDIVLHTFRPIHNQRTGFNPNLRINISFEVLTYLLMSPVFEASKETR